MNFCPKCGTKVSVGPRSSFCPVCGTKLAQEASSATNAADDGLTQALGYPVRWLIAGGAVIVGVMVTFAITMIPSKTMTCADVKDEVQRITLYYNKQIGRSLQRINLARASSIAEDVETLRQAADAGIWEMQRQSQEAAKCGCGPEVSETIRRQIEFWSGLKNRSF